jgi:hypothetical protein
MANIGKLFYLSQLYLIIFNLMDFIYNYFKILILFFIKNII